MRLTHLMAGLLFVGGAIAVPKIVGASGSRYDPIASQFSTCKGLLDRFRFDCGRYPTTEEGLNALRVAPSKSIEGWKEPYVTQVANDPWGSPYTYRANGSVFELISYGADGEPGGSGLDADLRVCSTGNDFE